MTATRHQPAWPAPGREGGHIHASPAMPGRMAHLLALVFEFKCKRRLSRALLIHARIPKANVLARQHTCQQHDANQYGLWEGVGQGTHTHIPACLPAQHAQSPLCVCVRVCVCVYKLHGSSVFLWLEASLCMWWVGSDKVFLRMTACRT